MTLTLKSCFQDKSFWCCLYLYKQQQFLSVSLPESSDIIVYHCVCWGMAFSLITTNTSLAKYLNILEFFQDCLSNSATFLWLFYLFCFDWSMLLFTRSVYITGVPLFMMSDIVYVCYGCRTRNYILHAIAYYITSGLVPGLNINITFLEWSWCLINGL